MAQAAVEAAVSANARVMALAGAAEHIAAGAPLYHPGMRDASMLTVRALASQHNVCPHQAWKTNTLCDHRQPQQPSSKSEFMAVEVFTCS